MTDAPRMSAAERKVRDELALEADLTMFDGKLVAELLRDLDMWRGIAKFDGDLQEMAAKRGARLVYDQVADDGRLMPADKAARENGVDAIDAAMRRSNLSAVDPESARLLIELRDSLRREPVPRLGDSDADIEIVARIIAEHVAPSRLTMEAAGGVVAIDGIGEAARAIIKLVRSEQGAGMTPRPMTDEEIEAAARSDPDNPPLTKEQLDRMMPKADWDLVKGIIALLPDDKVQALRMLDAAKRMVERFKR